MKYEGKLTISRVGRTIGEDCVLISLQDASSYALVVQIELLIKDFGDAITNVRTPCSFDWYPNAPVGKIRETKREVVLVPERNRTAAVKACAEFERDGWIASIPDALNHHNCIGGNRYSVVFHRFVPSEGV